MCAVIGVDRRTNRSTDRSTHDGTIATTDLIADCSPGGTTDSTTNGRINRGVICTGLNGN